MQALFGIAIIKRSKEYALIILNRCVCPFRRRPQQYYLQHVKKKSVT
jgi:hypothetical protein